MSRTQKKGLEYFPMDIDMFSDLKIRKLIKYQGGKAISIYALLLCNIYKHGYYLEWDDELPFICSELSGFDEAYISEVIKTCLSLGLFSKELFDKEHVLTSRGIQERYSRICTQSRRVCTIDYCNLLQGEEPRPEQPRQEETTPRYEPYSLTLDQEIEKLRSDECWLDQLQVLHSMPTAQLRENLIGFRLQCIADGKQGHQSLVDAKQHFNSWLRIVTKNKAQDDNNKPKGRNQRRGNILAANETKAYDTTF